LTIRPPIRRICPSSAWRICANCMRSRRTSLRFDSSEDGGTHRPCISLSICTCHLRSSVLCSMERVESVPFRLISKHDWHRQFVRPMLLMTQLSITARAKLQ
jgi:hypothetical protein